MSEVSLVLAEVRPEGQERRAYRWAEELLGGSARSKLLYRDLFRTVGPTHAHD